MSSYPYYVEYDYPKPPRRVIDNYFPLDVIGHDYVSFLRMPLENWSKMPPKHQDISSSVKQDRDTFQVTLEVQHYRIEELVVRTAGGSLIIEARHNERKDSKGYVTRNFSRRYPMPDSVNPDMIVAKLSADGMLTIIASLHAPPKNRDERVIPIIKTGRKMSSLNDY